ncbi:MAG: caspase family protein, partial [Acidimicrobiales bacterium]
MSADPRVGARRDAGDEPSPSIAPVGERWAVIVGVSRYADPGLNLKYAHRDAEQLYELVQTPEGGHFPASNIRYLVDEQATTSAVTRALRGFLLEAEPDSLVLLFLACHGGPDPRRPSGPLYLFTHDTDPKDVAGTALAMDEIDRSLR